MTGNLNDANAIGNEVVVPTSSVLQNIQNRQLVYTLPAYSVNVIRVPLTKGPAITKAMLQELVSQVKKLDKSKYTTESWAALQSALAEAEKQLASADLYQDMSAPYNKLKKAKDALKLKPTTLNPNSVKLNVGKKLTLGQKEKLTLKATVKPSKASQKVTWKSSKKSVVEVKNGKITAKKPGKATITVKTKNNKKAQCTITVKKAPKKISLNAKKKSLKKGKTFRIKVKFPKNTYSYKLTYSSNKKKIATVSSQGVVKAKKKGTAVITVKTFNGKKAKLTIKVK